MSKKIVLATIGSLGDVHPFIALGLALKARGFDPLVALPHAYVDKVERAGLAAAPIFPSFQEIGGMLGMSEEDATRRMFRDPDFLIRRLFLHYLDDSTKALDQLCDGAVGIVSTLYAMASPIVSEKRGIPFIQAILQPFTMFSPHDPPASPEFWMLARPPIGPAKLAWNRMEMAIIRLELFRRYAGPINRVRRRHGLGPTKRTPVFEGARADAPLVLGLWSEAFSPKQPDYPPNTLLPGFPVFDSDSGAPEKLDPELEAFLSEGEPPIIFTLGTFAVYAPGDFYGASQAIAKKLGRRALLLTGPSTPPPPAPGILVRAYAPHSPVFPRAALIVHHGGIGTTGQALRSGRPQLIVPHLGDQPDNGARIAHIGVGAMLTAKRYAANGEATLARLLTDLPMAARAAAIATKVRNEAGAETAAEAIARALAR